MAYTDSDPTITHGKPSGTEKSRKDKARNAATSAKEGVQDVADTVRTTAANAVERSGEHVQTVQSEFDSAVRRNPTLAVLGALGIGIAVGMAMNKRD